MADLLPCPFCGGPAHNYSQSQYWLGCKDCGAELPIFRDQDVAVTAWNRRAKLDETDNLTTRDETVDFPRFLQKGTTHDC